MARVSKNPLSRRRAAALKFLSSISFEVNNQSKEMVDDYFTQIERQTQTVTKENEKYIVTEEITTSKSIEYEFSRFTEISFRNRSNTGNSEGKHKELKQKKIAGIEDAMSSLCVSSSESIASGKQKSDHSSRMFKPKEIKVTNVNHLQYCKSERVMLLSSNAKIPFYVFSFLPYKKIKSKGDNKKENTTRRRNLSGSRPLSSFIDTLDPSFLLLGLEKNQNEQMISYQQFLLPSASYFDQKETSYQDSTESFQKYPNKISYHVSRCMSVDLGVSTKLHSMASSSPPEFRASDWEEFGFGSCCQLPYSPFLLDDPELMSGKHRTVLTFPSYRSSIIDYVRPSELKKELNEKFKEKFPYVDLTLSKLRSLKREMKKIAKSERCIDLLTVAQAYVYFEKLILKNVITKTNRKVCAAVCILLSAKMNDIKGNTLKLLFEKLESVFRLNRKDLISLEFAVLVALEFSLHVPTWEVLPHFQRLMYES